MARRTIEVTIELEGRDKGKVFRITEMSAEAGEDWATRFLLSAAAAGMEVPPEILRMGMAGVAIFGIRALSGLRFDEAKLLGNQLMACIEYFPNPERREVVRKLIADDIEEIMTRFKLKDEVLALHTGFSLAARLSSVIASSAAAALSGMQSTETSPQP